MKMFFNKFASQTQINELVVLKAQQFFSITLMHNTLTRWIVKFEGSDGDGSNDESL